MATKAYIVSQGSFSYDDNYYSSTEGGTPNKVFLTEEQAEEYAADISLAEFKDLVLNEEIFNYGYGDIDGVFDNSDALNDFCKEKFKMSSEDWWTQSRKYHPSATNDDEDVEIDMSDEDWKKFFTFCVLPLAFVNEVEFGDVFS